MDTYAGDEKGAGKKMIRKLKEVGFRNVLVGGVKKVRYMQMINKYHFDPWHLSPYEWKEYAQACVQYLNTQNCKTVVDIGCGLGEILQYIIGLDLQEEVIMAVQELNGGKIDFLAGSFGELTEHPIDYLITLNFMHGRTEEEWAETYHTAAVQNDVAHFVVDTVPEKVFGPATHSLDWGKILPDNYKRAERLGPFLSGRYVEVWERQ